MTSVRTPSAPLGVRSRPAWFRWGLPLVLLAAAIVIPFINVPTLGILPGSSLASPGSLLFLASAMAFAGAAISYDVIFGYTGLLSLGHSLFFGAGVYGFTIAQETLGLGFVPAILVTVAFGAILALIVGLPSLRVRGFAFAMVTLALASAGSVFVNQDPLDVTGGDVGRTLSGEGLPDWLSGIVDSRNVYWFALAVVLLIFFVSRAATRSPAGHVWQAIRENEDRVQILGIRTLRYKLGAWVLSGALAALAGIVYAIVFSGANEFVAMVECAIVIQIIVILGGVGTLWGSLVGALIYTFVGSRLPDIVSDSPLPDTLRGVLSEPLLPLGILFVVFVLWAPGGVAGLFQRRRKRPAVESGGEAGE